MGDEVVNQVLGDTLLWHTYSVKRCCWNFVMELTWNPAHERTRPPDPFVHHGALSWMEDISQDAPLQPWPRGKRRELVRSCRVF